jgi:hypothetical protein
VKALLAGDDAEWAREVARKLAVAARLTPAQAVIGNAIALPTENRHPNQPHAPKGLSRHAMTGGRPVAIKFIDTKQGDAG